MSSLFGRLSSEAGANLNEVFSYLSVRIRYLISYHSAPEPQRRKGGRGGGDESPARVEQTTKLITEEDGVKGVD